LRFRGTAKAGRRAEEGRSGCFPAVHSGRARDSATPFNGGNLPPGLQFRV
jgi:hypothetical protein